MIISVFDSVENIVGKGENAGYQHFLLYPQCFEKASFPDTSKGFFLWELVNFFPNDKFLDSSKLIEFADDNFGFDENGRNFFKQIETLWKKEKLLVMSNFSFSCSDFKRLVLQTRKTQGLCGKGLRALPVILIMPSGPVITNHSQEHSLSFSPRFAYWNVTRLPIG